MTTNNTIVDLNNHIEANHASKNAKYIKSIIYGGLDGIITTFSIISAAVGASLDIKYIISLGVANLVSDGLSMGLGDFISETFENKYILSERNKEIHEYENHREYEIQELKQLYSNEGLSQDDSNTIVDILSSTDDYKNIFIKHMLSLELGLEVSNQNPKINGLITFFSFILFGSFPVISYIICYSIHYEDYYTIYLINCFVSMITMFSLGIFQATITKQPMLKGGLAILIYGIFACSIAYFLGYKIQSSL